mmetsp:Transcript_1472/g.3973  ORF Transcript_1472/g.3973 Transcript_1472/m.3973 type:complete len:102 (-) Transcript_1472:18-323(-)
MPSRAWRLPYSLGLAGDQRLESACCGIGSLSEILSCSHGKGRTGLRAWASGQFLSSPTAFAWWLATVLMGSVAPRLHFAEDRASRDAYLFAGLDDRVLNRK